MPASADRNLLFGILAVQMDFITQGQLIAAMHAWVLDKEKPLGQILHDQKAISGEHRQLLEAMVAAHIQQHAGDPQQSLAAVSSASSIRAELEQIADPDVNASLICVAKRSAPDDPGATAAYQPTASGERYRILRPHARGGLGEVFVAEDTELHREIALKEIQERHAHDGGSRDRFVLEAEITGGLEHPGIVPVYGLGAYADGRPFYAMRFIKGDNLKEAIARFHKSGEGRGVGGEKDALEFRQLLGRFIDVCNAVAYAHSRGVLHRDLKPGNVMLGNFGETLVVDWGLAKVVGRADSRDNTAEPTLRLSSGSGIAETVAGTAVGTPAYMSPEQAAGKLDQLGPATDVYSLGATLYTLLTNRPPVAARETAEALRQVQHGDAGFSEPGASTAGLPRPLVAICRKAMSLRTTDRYATPLAFAEDLEHWLADEPVSAAPEPVIVRARRWMRKHPGPVSGMAASILVAVVGLTIGALLLGEKNQQLASANSTLENTNKQLDSANASLTTTNENLDLARKEAEKAAEAEKEATKNAVAAADKERKATALALNRLTQIEKAHALLESIFTDINPRLENKGGLLLIEQLTNRLLATADKLEEETIGDPLTVARLRSLLGNTLRSLGEPTKAIEQHAKARATREKLLGPDHPDTLKNMNNLAAGYRDAGKLDLALPLLEETLKLMKTKLGPDHPDTLTSMSNLAEGYKDVGKLDLALPLHEETLKLRKAKLGPDHSDTLASMHNLAAGYHAAGKLDLALPLNEETLKLMKAKLGPDHPDTLTSMSNLAEGYRAAGKLDLALPLMHEMLEHMKEKRGFHHPATLMSMNNLATGYHAAGKLDLALPHFEETLKRRKAKLGPDHPDTLSTMRSLLIAYRTAKKTTEADALAKELQSFRERSAKWFDTIHEVGKELKLTGKLDTSASSLIYQVQFRAGVTYTIDMVSPDQKALDPYLYLRDAGGKTLAEDDDSGGGLNARIVFRAPADSVYHILATTYNNGRGDFTLTVRATGKGGKGALENDAVQLAQKGVAHLRKKEYADAEPLLRQALEILQKKEPDTWTTFYTQSLLGASLLGQKKYQDAEPILLAGYDGLRQRAAKIPPQQRDSAFQLGMGLLAELYDATRSKDESKLQGTLTADKTQIVHEVKLTAGKAVVLLMNSTQFDTLLQIQDAKGKLLVENDDIDFATKKTNSRIWFLPPTDGVYRIVATSYQNSGRGDYEIVIRQYGSAKAK